MDINNQHLIEEFSNISAGRCATLKKQYIKAAAKGKDSKEAKKEAKLLAKCKGLVDFSDIPELNVQANPIQTPDMSTNMKSTIDEQPLEESKILGMKKAVAIPVIIVGVVILAFVGFKIYKKYKK